MNARVLGKESVARYSRQDGGMVMLRGFIAIEYLVLFAIMAALTIVGLTQFDDQIRGSVQALFGDAAEQMAN